MSELVATKQESAAQLVRLTKQPGRMLSLLSIPERYKRDFSGRESGFLPAIDVGWLEKSEQRVQNLGLIGLAIEALFGVAALPVGVMTPEGFPILFGVVAAAQVYWIAPGLLVAPVLKGRRRNFQALLNWLQARYGLTLNSRQGLYKFIQWWPREKRALTFADDQGRVVTLRSNDSTGYYVSQGDSTTEYPLTLAAKARQVKKAAEVSLPEDLKALHADIDRLIVKLSQRNLSPESEHTVSRAGSDLGNVLALYADLHELDVVTEPQLKNVSRVLNQLKAELTEVLQRETEWALNALSVETTYVTSREERKGFKIAK